MKKIAYALAFVGAVLVASCSTGNDESANVQPENKVLKFSSGKQMQEEITRIENRKAAQDAVLLQAILDKNGLTAPQTADDVKNAPVQNDFDAAVALEQSVVFYHQQRLQSIAELRQELHFTSIQSIADEINSLRVTDPEAAQALYERNQTLLKDTEYGATTIFPGGAGNIVSVNGKVAVDGVSLDLTNPEVAGKWLRDESVKQGVLAGNANYRIVWSAGRSAHKDDIGHSFYRSWTQLASLVWYNGSWVLYPSYFFTNGWSEGNFAQGFDLWVLGFPGGAGTFLREESDEQNGIYLVLGGSVSGNYSAPVGNTFWNLTGSITYN